MAPRTLASTPAVYRALCALSCVPLLLRVQGALSGGRGSDARRDRALRVCALSAALSCAVDAVAAPLALRDDRGRDAWLALHASLRLAAALGASTVLPRSWVLALEAFTRRVARKLVALLEPAAADTVAVEKAVARRRSAGRTWPDSSSESDDARPARVVRRHRERSLRASAVEICEPVTPEASDNTDGELDETRGPSTCSRLGSSRTTSCFREPDSKQAQLGATAREFRADSDKHEPVATGPVGTAVLERNAEAAQEYDFVAHARTLRARHADALRDSKRVSARLSRSPPPPVDPKTASTSLPTSTHEPDPDSVLALESEPTPAPEHTLPLVATSAQADSSWVKSENTTMGAVNEKEMQTEQTEQPSAGLQPHGDAAPAVNQVADGDTAALQSNLVCPTKNSVQAEFVKDAENTGVADKIKALNAWTSAQPKLRQGSIQTNASDGQVGLADARMSGQVTMSDSMPLPAPGQRLSSRFIPPTKGEVSAQFVDADGTRPMTVLEKTRALQAYVDGQHKFRDSKTPLPVEQSAPSRRSAPASDQEEGLSVEESKLPAQFTKRVLEQNVSTPPMGPALRRTSKGSALESSPVSIRGTALGPDEYDMANALPDQL